MFLSPSPSPLREEEETFIQKFSFPTHSRSARQGKDLFWWSLHTHWLNHTVIHRELWYPTPGIPNSYYSSVRPSQMFLSSSPSAQRRRRNIKSIYISGTSWTPNCCHPQPTPEVQGKAKISFGGPFTLIGWIKLWFTVSFDIGNKGLVLLCFA